MNCPLCDAPNCRLFFRDNRRSFHCCKVCELLFVPAAYHVSPEEEKKRYELHDNRPNNKGYVRFLEEIVKVIEVIEAPKSTDQKILDFGSGKHAVLGGLLQRKGFSIDSYDPLYALGREYLSKRYDILVIGEVIEHVRNLKDEILIIKNLVMQNGKLILRTKLYPSCEEFSAWWYKEDITHINFFARKSIEVFALKIGFKIVEERREDIFVLRELLKG